MDKPKPRLESGYAYLSSRRYPVAPESVVVTPESENPSYVGTAKIEGNVYNAFRCRSERSNWAYYLFQLQIPPF